MQLKRTIISIIRAIFSLTLIGILIWKVGVDSTWEQLANAKWEWVLLSVALVVVTIVLHAIRWRLVVSALGSSFTPSVALREMWIGYFFNQLLPTSVGGDVVRGFRHYRMGVPLGLALRCVLVERVFGLIACIALGVFAVPLLVWYSPGGAVTTFVGILMVAALMACLLLLHPPLTLLSRLPGRFSRQVRFVIDGIMNRDFRANAIGISLLMQLAMAGCLACLSAGLAVEVHPLWVAILLQPITLVTLIPISLAGWGLREGAFVAIFGAIGVSAGASLPLSLSLGLVMLIGSLPGWLALLLAHRTDLLTIAQEAQIAYENSTSLDKEQI